MLFHKNLLSVAILAVIAPSVFAQDDESAHTLSTIQLQAHPLVQSAADFAVADHVVDHK